MKKSAKAEATGRQQGSGAQDSAPEPRFLAVGAIAGVHGVRGELKVEVLTDNPDRFGVLTRIFIGPDDPNVEPSPYQVTGYRMHKRWLLLKLTGIDDRDEAAALRGQLLQVPIEEAVALEEGEYFEHQILGLEVWTTAGEHLGQVADILYSAANDVYVVRAPGVRAPEVLIPAIAEVIQEVDLEGRRLVVDLPEGLR